MISLQKNKHLKIIHDYISSLDVFNGNNVKISGGISFFLYDNLNNYDEIKYFLHENNNIYYDTKKIKNNDTTIIRYSQ